jgi:Tol biopolymer transport system component
MDLDRGTRTRLTFSERADWSPLWSPDGHWIAFCSTREGAGNLYRKPADGSREAERLLESENLQVPESWSRDGRYIALSELTGGGGWDIKVLDVESGEVMPFLESSFQDISPAFSPDGRWIAYRSNESGRYEVYVRPFPGPGGKWQISTSGGGAPLWSQDGKQIYYATPDDKMVAVPITATESTLTAGNPVELLDTEPYMLAFFRGFDLSPDGRTFALLKPAGEVEEAPDRTHVNFIVNWFEQLERMDAGVR